MSIPVSVIILTKNEEAGIKDTIRRVREFDEVIVVDSGSSDDTVAIAQNEGARVVQFTWNGRYPKKKQWALEHSASKHDWILLLDADEYPGPALVSEIRDLARRDLSSFGAFDLKLRYRFAGRFLRHGHVVTKRSLLRKGYCSFPVVDDLEAPGIREVEGHYQPVSTLRIESLRAVLFHDDRDPIGSWFDRHNRYADWEAHLRQNPAARRNIASKRSRNGQIFDRLPAKPALFFAYGYVAKLGFLDGRAGFDYHFALATYYWQIDVKCRDLRRQATESSS